MYNYSRNAAGCHTHRVTVTSYKHNALLSSVKQMPVPNQTWRVRGRGSISPDQRMPAHTHKTKIYEHTLFCTFHASQVQCRKKYTNHPFLGLTLTKPADQHEKSLHQSQVHGKLQNKECRWLYLSCNNAGMLMFQPMACLSNPQVNRLHMGWSSLHAEQHTILLWPYYQSHKRELVHYSWSIRAAKPQPI